VEPLAVTEAPLSAPTAELAAARARVIELESLLREHEREAAVNEQQMAVIYRYLLGLYEIMPGALVTVTPNGEITRTNRAFHGLLGIPAGSRITRSLERFWPGAMDFLRRCRDARDQRLREEVEWIARDGEHVPLLLSAACQHGDDGELQAVICIGLDMREQRKLELQLRHVQKLESLGQLAAGIAHEINTPMQFVNDNLHFIRDAFTALLPALDVARGSAGEADAGERIKAAMDAADADFLRERVPRAVERSIEGVARVAGIVEAMKRFSHPRTELAEVDLNRALADALIVAHNEYRYVADVVTDYGELPKVIGNGSDLNQVFLNLLVNAAHAIEARGDGSRGTITVRTRADGEQVVVSIGDTGTGIPEAIRHRIFDPFFTTKEVGKGSGQGLAIARAVVVDRHQGQLDFETAPGAGTTFHIRLPIGGPSVQVGR
jgi:signal transduction histidine kinase